MFTVACVSIAVNAQLNKVSIEISADNIILNPKNRWDVVLTGNMVCQQNETLLLVKWLNDLRQRGKVVLIGDPGRPFVQHFKCLDKVAEYRLPEHTIEQHGYFTKTKVFRLSQTNKNI